VTDIIISREAVLNERDNDQKIVELSNELQQIDLQLAQQELIESDSNQDAKKTALNLIDPRVYTIQLKATQNPLNIDQMFRGLEGVNEFKSNDGLYKYYCGEYLSLSKAKEALLAIQKAGYKDAFIRNLYSLITH